MSKITFESGSEGRIRVTFEGPKGPEDVVFDRDYVAAVGVGFLHHALDDVDTGAPVADVELAERYEGALLSVTLPGGVLKLSLTPALLTKLRTRLDSL